MITDVFFFFFSGLRLLAIGRNQYIELMNQCRSSKVLKFLHSFLRMSCPPLVCSIQNVDKFSSNNIIGIWKRQYWKLLDVNDDYFLQTIFCKIYMFRIGSRSPLQSLFYFSETLFFLNLHFTKSNQSNDNTQSGYLALACHKIHLLHRLCCLSCSFLSHCVKSFSEIL